MSSLKHTIAVLLAIGLAYLWLTTPALSSYSLQAFAVTTVGFFITKRIYGSKIWHVLPRTHSIEIVFISFAVVLLIGSTGNASSLFYPFAYIHLFFLAMTTRQNTAIAATLATMLAHYTLEPTITTASIATFLTLPIMLIFFLFSRRQYDDARLQQKMSELEAKQIDELEYKEHNLESFINTFLQPKLNVLKDLIETAIQRGESVDPTILEKQITLLATESQKVLQINKRGGNKTDSSINNQETVLTTEPKQKS